MLEYGDINFAYADNFVRFDSSVDRIESIRGGSASTFAPYLNIGFDLNDRISIDASVRRDSVEARGRRLDGCCGGNESTFQGTTDYFVGDNNDLQQDGYNLINLYGVWYITDALSANININNVTDEFVITESEEGSGNPGAIIRARALSGTTTSIGVTWSF